MIAIAFPLLAGGCLRSTRRKTAYIVETTIKELVRKRGKLFPILCTLTFADNLVGKPEARKRWKRLRERLLAEWPDLKGCGVWQRQARGAWHLHLILNHAVAVTTLRDMATACGWGVQMRLDYIGGRDGFRGKSVASVCRYVTRYITRDMDDEDGGEHLTVWLNTKCGTTNFHWHGGMATLRRRGLDFVANMDGEAREFLGWDRNKFAREIPWETLARIGWDSMSQDERILAVMTDDAVLRWAHGPPGEGNDLEPF